MRVLFVTYPGPSHYFPIVALAQAVRSSGHEVLVATQPSFAPDVTRTGLSAVAVGPDLDASAMFRAGFASRLRQTAQLPAQWPDTVQGLRDSGLLPGVLTGLGHFADVAGSMADDLLDLGRTWRPDLVVHAPTAFAGAALARALGVPGVRHLWGPDFFHLTDELDAAPLSALAARFGLDSLQVGGDLVVDPAPPELQAPGTGERQLVRCVPYNGTVVVPSWLREHPPRPRVCLTWGTWIRDMRLRHIFRVPDILDALAGMDVDVVVTATESEREMLGALPGNVQAVDPVPLHLLLPSCAAIVHQGGTGTLMTALVHGVPQLVLPQIPDQIFNAGRLARTGAGIHLPNSLVTPDEIRACVHTLLDTGGPLRGRTEQLRQTALAQPAPTEVVEVLEKLAG